MAMTPDTPAGDDWPRKIAELAIRMGVLAILLIWCYRILEPFVLPTVWGVIIAVAIFPLYRRVLTLFGGRRALAATLIAGAFLVLLMTPTLMLTKSLVQNVAELAQSVDREKLVIPPPPDAVKQWPLVGEFVANTWNLAATNLPEALKIVQPQLKAVGSWLVEVAASAGFGLLMLVIAFVIFPANRGHASKRLVVPQTPLGSDGRWRYVGGFDCSLPRCIRIRLA
jgi:predicted PurR-regulated permease PerM